MPRKTREEAMRTRQKLIDSALDVMSERPYSSVSMTEIAKRIGYSKGAIYWHFLNKSELVIQMIENAFEQYEAALSFCDDEQPAPSYETLRVYYERKMTKPFESERFKRLQHLLARRDEWPEDMQTRVSAIFRRCVGKERSMVERNLRKAQESGSLKPNANVHELATLISVVFHGMFVFGLQDLYEEKLDFLKYTDFIFDAFYQELKPAETIKKPTKISVSKG